MTDALMMALWRRGKPEQLMHHSDCGSQYTSESFQRLLRDLGITCSMSRSGNVWDNSVMETGHKSILLDNDYYEFVLSGRRANEWRTGKVLSGAFMSASLSLFSTACQDRFSAL